MYIIIIYDVYLYYTSILLLFTCTVIVLIVVQNCITHANPLNFTVQVCNTIQNNYSYIP